jgi:hypothetical protein
MPKLRDVTGENVEGAGNDGLTAFKNIKLVLAVCEYGKQTLPAFPYSERFKALLGCA